MSTRTQTHSPWLRGFSKLMVLATVILIFLGGQVKSHDAGLAVPDWPTTYGENMFLFPVDQWVGNIFHEHLHRVVAAGVGFLCIILALWLGLREERRWLRWLAFGALGAVIFQGILGGLTVRYMLPTAISVSHAMLAQTFLVITVIIAYSLSRERVRRVESGEPPAFNALTRPAIYLLSFVFLQLFLGALMRHTESGLAIPDFPTMGGQWLPIFTPDTVAAINETRYEIGHVNNQPLDPVSIGQVWIHFMHRAGALIVTLGAIVCTVAAWRIRKIHAQLWRTVLSIDAIVLFQATLGIATVMMRKTPWITSLHVATGAALLGLCALLALRAYPLQLRLPSEESSAPLQDALAK